MRVYPRVPYSPGTRRFVGCVSVTSLVLRIRRLPVNFQFPLCPLNDRVDVAVQYVAQGQQPRIRQSSCVGASQISWSPIFIDASADRHFNRSVDW